MKELKEVIVGKNKYVIECLPATESTKLLVKILKIIMGPGAAFFSSGPSSVRESVKGMMDKQVDIGGALGALASRLDEDEVLGIIQQTFMYVRFEGKQLNETMEVHFQGELGYMFQVFSHALKRNYESFFSEIPEIANILFGEILKRKAKNTTPATTA